MPTTSQAGKRREASGQVSQGIDSEGGQGGAPACALHRYGVPRCHQERRLDAKGADLPGNWESRKFNLPASLVEAIPQIEAHDTSVVMPNDGVAQGLSKAPLPAGRRFLSLSIFDEHPLHVDADVDRLSAGRTPSKLIVLPCATQRA
jgi:hypothetical protein